MFYFIEPAASDNTDVTEFRKTLAGQELLYSSVDETLLLTQVEKNLTGIFTTWKSWPQKWNRTKRQLRRVSLTALVLLAIPAMGSDFYVRAQINTDIEAGDAIGAASQWAENSPLMTVNKNIVRGRINQLMIQNLKQASTTQAKLELYRQVRKLSPMQ